MVTVVGAQLTVVAVPAQIYALTGSSAYVGLTGLFGLVPLVVFGLWGGAVADWMDRRTLLLITTVGLIGTAVLFWVQAAAGGSVWLLLGLFSLQQAFFAVNQPTRGALLPRILPAHLLPAGNALNFTTMMAGSIAGPLLAGVMIPLIGVAWLYFLDALLLLPTLYAVWALPPLPVQGAAAAPPGLRAVLDGFRYLSGHPVLAMSFVVDLIAMIFGMPRALFPEIADVRFGGDPEGGLAFALLFAAIPIGAVLGGVLSGWVSRVSRHGLAVLVCVAIWGVAVAGFGGVVALATPGAAGLGWLLTLAVVMLAAGGAADVASAAFRSSILQSAADDALRGRMQGLFTVVVAGGPRIADVLHGAVAGAAGAAVTAAAGGVLVVIGVGVVALLAPGFVRYRAPAAETPKAPGSLPGPS